MHPAKSVIIFTTTSGAGAGLLIWLAVFGLAGRLSPDLLFHLTGFGVAFVLVTVGLLSSVFHLGHPERAWRALSQWRSSWLSREGVAALVTYPLAVEYAAALYCRGASDLVTRTLGIAAVILAVLFVICTGMIYASLRPIKAWANPYVPTGYVLFALMTGAILFAALQAVFSGDYVPATGFAIGLLAMGLMHKLGYWRFIDQAASRSTPETATGLGHLGRVRLLEGPHSEANYLMQEMGFRIARKHAHALRRVVLIAGFILPSLALVAALVLSAAAFVFIFVAAISCALGIVVERWLFFAEAKHTVAMYYGAPSA